MKLIFATHNPHKAEEITSLVRDDDIQIVTLADLDFHEDIEETADSFEGNAMIKAEAAYRQFGDPAFADDSGLVVPALDGQPGVYSARFAGPQKNDQDNNNKLLTMMSGIADRYAYFVSVIAYYSDHKVALFEGRVEGEITFDAKGSNGFGYDPIFKPKGYDATFAQLDDNIKNSISHRYHALTKFVDYLISVKRNP